MDIRIGFIGVGGIAQEHIKSIIRIEGAAIVSVYDVNAEAARSTAALTGAQVMESADQVLDKQQIDLVFICTPQFARGELEVTAARRGIPFFVEKPLGVDLEDVIAKERIIRETGIIHAVGYVLRYFDTVRQAKSYLEGKRPHLIQAFRVGGSHPARWWKQLDTSGGHLVDTVTHQVDMIRYIAGEFSEVQGKFGRVSFEQLEPDSTIYDAGAVNFRMQSGAVGSITESCMSPFFGVSDIRFFGADFFLELRGNGSELTIIDADQHVSVSAKCEPGLEQCKAIIDAVRTGSAEAIASHYTDALATLRVTLEASKEG